MNLTHLASYLEVIDCGSFRRAAEKLGISQPAVSQHVRKLEESLGTQLINRSGDGCTPSEGTSEFVRHARSLLRLANRTRDSLVRSEVVVGASSNVGIYLIQPAFKRFLDEAGVKGRLEIDTNPRIADSLRTGEIDVAVMEWWDSSSDPSGEFLNEEWKVEELIVVVGPDHPWAGRRSIPPGWLADEEILGGESGTGTGTLLKESLGDLATDLRVTRSLGSTAGVKEGIKAGLGISLLMKSSVEDDMAAGSLVGLKLRGVRIRKSIRLIRRSSSNPESLPVRFCHEVMKHRKS